MIPLNFEPIVEDEARRDGKRAPRLPYGRPTLIEYGNLRGLTLGGSPGAGDSGSGGVKQPPAFFKGYDNLP